jgi:hypothetical protein
MLGLLWEGLAAGRADDVGDAGDLRGEDPVAEAGEAIVAAACVVGEAGLFNEVVTDHSIDGAVEGPRTHFDGAAFGFGSFFHDGVAVFFSAGEREEDSEDGWGEGEMVFEVAWGGVCHASDYISVADISATDICGQEETTADLRGYHGLKAI